MSRSTPTTRAPWLGLLVASAFLATTPGVLACSCTAMGCGEPCLQLTIFNTKEPWREGVTRIDVATERTEHRCEVTVAGPELEDVSLSCEGSGAREAEWFAGREVLRFYLPLQEEEGDADVWIAHVDGVANETLYDHRHSVVYIREYPNGEHCDEEPCLYAELEVMIR